MITEAQCPTDPDPALSNVCKNTIFDDFNRYLNTLNVQKFASAKKNIKSLNEGEKLKKKVSELLTKLRGRMKAGNQNPTEKFDSKMKLFNVLDSYINANDYFKKINLIYNPNIYKIIYEQKKDKVRSAYFDPSVFKIKLNNKEEETFKKDNLIEPKEEYFHEKEKEEGNTNKQWETNLKQHLIKSVENTKKISLDNEKEFLEFLNEKINEEIAGYNNEETSKFMEKKQIISQKNIRLKMDREKNAYDKEMEKFQGLIENSIDFDLIKKCTSQQNDNPLNFYYHAYKKHSEKIQEILKKKCTNLYKQKAEMISNNSLSLEKRLEGEVKKLGSFVPLKLQKNLDSSIFKPKAKKLKYHMADPIYFPKSKAKKASIISYSLPKINISDSSNNKKSNLSKFWDSSKMSKKTINTQNNLSTSRDQTDINNDKNNIKKFLKKIIAQERENSIDKIFMKKEINDIDEVFRDEIDQLKRKHGKNIDSIRDFDKVDLTTLNTKNLKSFFSTNKKKNKINL